MVFLTVDLNCLSIHSLDSVKTFSFNAGSFKLDTEVEVMLRQNNAITLDFGSAAYIDSEIVSKLLCQLVDNRKQDLVAIEYLRNQLESADKRSSEQDLSNTDYGRENNVLKSQVSKLSADLDKSARLVKEYSSTIDALRTEITKLRLSSSSPDVSKNNSSQAYNAQRVETADKGMNMELNKIRVRYAEALASLKVLEDENGELTEEIEQLRKQSRQAAVITQSPS